MKTLKAITVLLIGSVISVPHVYATETNDIKPQVTKAYFDTRADFLYEDIEHQDESQSGIHGKYLNFRIDGSLNEQLTFSWRQRLNKFKEAANDVFSATDWIYIDYKPCQNFSIAGGKQVVLIGGYEYDANPINIYFASRFWNNIGCYQFGGSASYHTTDGNHTLTMQICNSPFQPIGSSCYAYNLFWSGNMGCLQTLWSVNLIEYQKGHYTNYIALGNRVDLGDFNIEADVMNRATSHHKYWFADYSLIGKVEYNATSWMTIMAKGGKDRIGIDDAGEMWPVGKMMSKPFYGGGLEFYPCHGSRDVRVHAIAARYYDNESLGHTDVSVGVTWRLNLK